MKQLWVNEEYRIRQYRAGAHMLVVETRGEKEQTFPKLRGPKYENMTEVQGFRVLRSGRNDFSHILWDTNSLTMFLPQWAL